MPVIPTPPGNQETAAASYDELRKLAAGHMANECPGHTLDATGLVHEAYLRLVGSAGDQPFVNLANFFAAAAEATRRILVDSARRKQSLKRGGGQTPAVLDPDDLPASLTDADSLIDLDEASTAFGAVDATAAEMAKLRVFGGCRSRKPARSWDCRKASAFRQWTYARAWLTAQPPNGQKKLETLGRGLRLVG